jgi:hypothetical protein
MLFSNKLQPMEFLPEFDHGLGTLSPLESSIRKQTIDITGCPSTVWVHPEFEQYGTYVCIEDIDSHFYMALPRELILCLWV